jgi:spore coat protein U-like protein
MTFLALRLALLALAAAASLGARAAITCTITSPGFAAAYSATATNANVTQTYFTVTCTRGSTRDPTSVNYTVRVDNGLNPQGNTNRARFGGNRIRYDLYQDAGCSSDWRGPRVIDGTINFSGTGTVSQQGDYWGCIPARQTGLASGTYTDIVTMTMTYGRRPTSTATGSIGVTIVTPPTCSVTTAPGNIVFNYVSFGPAANASTNFGVTCSLALPYTIGLDATSGTIVGLTYTLALSATNATGTGVEQTHSINGTIAAGQPGTCSTGLCSGTQARAITITY